MKGSFGFQIALALLLGVSQAQVRWEMHRLPGGSTVETVIVNEENVKGMWIIEKQAGAYWVQWNTSTNTWDPLNAFSEYDAYYPWFMGGDERKIGDTLYTIVATYQGTHRYSWDGDSWEPHPSPNINKAPNSYYRWHDAAFVADEGGAYHPDHFIVCSVPEWSPDPVNEYRKGLYLIVNGQAPDPDDPPILNTGGHDYRDSYSNIYRDMDNGRYLYTWYGYQNFATGAEECDFQKITISGYLQAITAAADTDFDEPALDVTLKNIMAFYQYTDEVPEPFVRHQFILAKSVSVGRDTTIDVWHREHNGGGFSSAGWTKICQNLENQATIPGYAGSMGLVAYKEDNNYIIYLVANHYGLVHIKVPVGQPQNPTITPFSQDAGDGTYLRRWGDRSLNLNPWWRASHPDSDQVIIGSPHADLHLATIANPTATPAIATYKNVEDWSGFYPNGTARKGGPYYTWSYVAGSATEAYFIHDGTGIFKADTDPWIHYGQMGTGGTYIQSKSDFNFGFRCGAMSPFDSNYLLVGGVRIGFFWNAENPIVYHGGIWKLNLDNPTAQMETTNLASPNNVIQSMAADPEDGRLYYSSPNISDDFWPEENWELMRDNGPKYLRTSTGSHSEVIAHTGTGSLDQHKYVYYWLWPQGEEFYAGFRVLKRHPAEDVIGVLYGLVCPGWDIDWGEAPTEPDTVNPRNRYVGGGLGYLYYDNSPIWPSVKILDIAHHTDSTVMWFENVMDMVVESNSDYTPPDLNVDILAACGAYQVSRKGEDYPRYGGLFKVHYDPQLPDWVIADITPITNDYQLGPFSLLDHPAVTCVDSVNVSGMRYYFCTTMGDKFGYNDEPLCLLWYQQADNIRDPNFTSAGWIKWDAVGTVPYPDQHEGSANVAFWQGWAVEPAGGTLVNLFLDGVVAEQANLSP